MKKLVFTKAEPKHGVFDLMNNPSIKLVKVIFSPSGDKERRFHFGSSHLEFEVKSFGANGQLNKELHKSTETLSIGAYLGDTPQPVIDFDEPVMLPQVKMMTDRGIAKEFTAVISLGGMEIQEEDVITTFWEDECNEIDSFMPIT